MRTAALSELGLSLGAYSLSNGKKCSSSSCKAIVAVECLPSGQSACAADALQNIGTSNIGWGNFGSGNVGYKNIGEAGGVGCEARGGA